MFKRKKTILFTSDLMVGWVKDVAEPKHFARKITAANKENLGGEKFDCKFYFHSCSYVTTRKSHSTKKN